ncbi:ABC transporter substrate-binding protein [Citricoccus sp. GCM10030269]|uniref:ABC transporter substrate-binding protein n=1 Tax=Citricoccus sp. GCM10030269 TaxID=3273388 RepID=UPI003615F943
MQQKSTRPLLATVGLAIATMLAGCGTGASAGGSDGSGDTQTVRISQAFQSLLYLPLYVADDQGFFEGVDVEIQTGGGGQQSWASVLGGSADFSIHDPVFGAISKAEGGPGIAVASVQNAPSVWMVGSDTDDLQDDISQVAGSSIATMPEPDTTWAFMNYLLQENGLSASDVEIVPTSIGNEMAPLLSGQTDYALGTEPQISQVEAEGMHAVYAFPENPDWYPYAFSSLMTTEAFAEQNPEATQAVVDGFELASRFIYEHPDESADIAKKAFPDLDESVVEAAVARQIDVLGYPETVEITKKAWANVMRVSDFVGIVDKDAESSAFEAVVDNSFAEKAKENVDAQE